MKDKKLTKEINRAIRLSFFLISLVMILATMISFIALQGNEFNSFENTFVRLVKMNSPHFANEIFLEQVEALDLRIQEIFSTIKEQYPKTKTCLEINSIHKENALPKQIAFRCDQKLLFRKLALLHEIKLGENIIGNIRYTLEGEGLMENKLFRFIIIALILAIIITLLFQHYFGMKFTNTFVIPLIHKVVLAESDAKKYETMKKMAHDSEAPIVVLENLLDKKEALSEEERKVGIDSLSRIRLINSAALRGVSLSSQKEIVRLRGLLESVMTEKKIQYQEECPLKLKLQASEFDYFINIEQINLMRAFSNLIDNAVEAIEDRASAAVSISLKENSNMVEIAIQDNGRGIPEEILTQIQFQPFSYGKKGGSGLGMRNAIDIVKNSGGQLKIESQVGIGTTILITLPYVKRASAVRPLYLDFSQDIVILDDTIEIYKTWKNIFFQIDFPEENLHFFSKVESFRNYIKNKKHSALFFIDYDLGHQQNGIDLIKEFSLMNNSFLVTSYSNDISLIEDCERNNIKIIPKKEIRHLKFKKLPLKCFVHLDDSSLLRKSWLAQAKKSGTEILSFENPEKLFDNLSSIPKETKFFIDKNLSENTNGLQVCKKLFGLNYHQLFISTAETDIDLSEYRFIKGIIGKKFPENFKTIS